MKPTTNETVNQWMAERGSAPPFSAMVQYDPDGDCLEFLLSNAPFYGRRLDGWVTAYYSEDTNEVVGGLIKGVKTSLLRRFPGLNIEINGNTVQVVFLLRASAWQATDQVKQAAYKAVIQKAEEADIRAELVAAGA